MTTLYTNCRIPSFSKVAHSKLEARQAGHHSHALEGCVVSDLCQTISIVWSTVVCTVHPILTQIA